MSDKQTSVTVPVSVSGYGVVEVTIECDDGIAELYETSWLASRADSFAEDIANDLHRRRRAHETTKLAESAPK